MEGLEAESGEGKAFLYHFLDENLNKTVKSVF